MIIRCVVKWLWFITFFPTHISARRCPRLVADWRVCLKGVPLFPICIIKLFYGADILSLWAWYCFFFFSPVSEKWAQILVGTVSLLAVCGKEHCWVRSNHPWTWFPDLSSSRPSSSPTGLGILASLCAIWLGANFPNLP